MLKAHVIEITKACAAAFMRRKTVKSEIFFLKLLLKFFVNVEMLFMADLLPNGLHQNVMICSICYINKSRLDVQFVKKIPLEKFNR